MTSDGILHLKSKNVFSPRPYKLEELRYDGGWKRKLAITLWSIVSLVALLCANWTTSAIITLIAQAENVRWASTLPTYDQSYSMGAFLGILLFYGFLVLFTIAAWFALFAIFKPSIVRIHSMRYDPKGQLWNI